MQSLWHHHSFEYYSSLPQTSKSVLLQNFHSAALGLVALGLLLFSFWTFLKKQKNI
jgi:hypothetical protein